MLQSEGTESHVVDAASILTSRRRRRAKTDRIDGEALVRKRTAQVRFVNWYLAKLYQAGQRDAVLATRFLEVANLMKQPPVLLEPRIAMRVWQGNRRAISVAAS